MLASVFVMGMLPVLIFSFTVVHLGDVMKMIRAFLKNESGATAIEYGLIAALIAVAAIVAMGTVGNNLGTTFNNVSSKLV